MHLLRRALLACLLFVVPTASAQAAAPGVNVADHKFGDDAASVAQVAALAADTGAKTARFFVDAAALEGQAQGQLLVEYGDLTAALNARGVKPAFVIVPGGDGSPPNPQQHAATIQAFARRIAARGEVFSYEIGNEVDDPSEGGTQFWRQPAGARAATYANLVNVVGPAIKQVTSAAVVLAPLVGNDYAFVEALAAAGLDGAAFDAAAVHTDTACLSRSPEAFYREADGRLGRYTFLGYREVRASMLKAGWDKPIFMTELGWAASGDEVCSKARDEGKNARGEKAGVSEDQQAEFLLQAFNCMAEDAYLQQAWWFTLYNLPPRADEQDEYGLLREDRKTRKPAYEAFTRTVAAGGDPRPGGCGADFAPPTIQIKSPVNGQQFLDKIDIQAAVADAGVGFALKDGMQGRVSFYADGEKLVNYGPEKVLDGATFGLKPWYGAAKLGLGPHKITVEALDRNGNAARQDVMVEKVATMASTLTPKFKLGKPRCKGRRCTISGQLLRGTPGTPSLGGKVRVAWEIFRRGKWRKLSGGLKPANKKFTFVLKRAAFKGRWRVKVTYDGLSPWKPAKGRTQTFRVR